ncbi:MAG TPA: Na+/H+ antiporter NhaA, partial [Polyangiaceae bacterium]|nr:Na+/H+ antiporter NhaA [Polyangiaceae bacterium]
LGRLGVRGVPVYLVAGTGLWLAIDASGVHPSIAGVLLGLLTPAREWMSGVRVHRILARVIAHPTATHRRNVDERHDLRSARIAATEAVSPVERIEFRLHPWSAFFIMPVFALANAGVSLSWEKLMQPVSVAVATALLVGKPIGVLLMCWLAERTGLGKRPTGLPWSLIAGGSILTGIGFTMSIFIADLAFDEATLDAAKVGILAASLTSGALGLLVLFLMTMAKRQAAKQAPNLAT